MMNKNFLRTLAISACLFVFNKVSAQQVIPFKFIESNSHLTSLVKHKELDSLTELKHKKLISQKNLPPDTSMGEVLVSYTRPRNHHDVLADKFEAQAKKLDEDISLKYRAVYSAIDETIMKSKDHDEIEQLKREKRMQEKKEKNEKKIVGIFLNLAKEERYLKRTSSNFVLFPVRSSTDAQLYYNKEIDDSRNKFLQHSLINYSPDGGKASIFNEVFADYADRVRLGIGVLVSNKDNVEDQQKGDSIIQKDAIQRLIGGGGNFLFNTSLPLAGYDSKDEQFSIKLLFAPKVGLDVPELGTESNDYAFNCDIGFQGSVFYTLANAKITLFSNFRFGHTIGNKTFYKNLLKTDEKSFNFSQFSAGLALNSIFRINWSTYFGSDFVKDNFNHSLGFSVVPN